MTLCIAASFDGGVMLASDSAMCDDSGRMFTPGIKGFENDDLSCLYAGELWATDRAIRATKTSRNPESFAADVAKVAMEFKDKESSGHPDFPAEFIVVGKKTNIITLVGGEGGWLSGYDWLVIGNGSIEGLPGMELVYVPLRNKTEGAVKKALTNVLRVTAKYNVGVFGPFHFETVR